MATWLTAEPDNELTTSSASLIASSSWSSSSNSSSRHLDTVQYKLVVNVYIATALCVFGILGNVVSIVVLGLDRSIRRTTGLLLRALGVADTVYLVMCLLFQAVKTAHDVTDWLPGTVRRVWPYVEPYIWPLASIAQTCNVGCSSTVPHTCSSTRHVVVPALLRRAMCGWL